MDDYLVEQFSRFSLTNIQSKKCNEYNNCQYCGRTQQNFSFAPHCNFIGIFTCDNIKCKNYAKKNIYEYCIQNSRYPLTENIISKFFNNIFCGWYVLPFSFTYIEEGNIVLTITNYPEFSPESRKCKVSLNYLCQLNSLDINEVINDLQLELHNLIK